MEPGLSDFLQQIPLQLIVMFCGSAVALIVAFAIVIGARNRRAQAVAASAQSSAALYTPPVNAFSGGEDLPDLDSLVTQEVPIIETAPPRVARSGTFSIRLTDGDDLEVVEVLTVLRDVTDGGLLIQIGDRIYRNPPALADAEFKRRFNTTISELAKNLSVGVPRPTKSAPPPPPRPGVPAEQARFAPPVPTPPPDEPGNEADMPTDEDFLPPTNTPERSTGTLPAALYGDLPKFNLPDKPITTKPLRRVPKPSNEPIPEIDVGGSVEAYLQYKVSQSPEFAGRSIHIRSNPQGGIKIEVDGVYYDSVAEVEDVVAQAFLRASIEEWQSRQ